MSAKAGESFICVVCKDPHPLQEQPAYDEYFEGPICEECRRNSNWAAAYLKRYAKANHIVGEADITPQNCNRLSKIL